MRLKIYYIAKPYYQNQAWGIYNPLVYAKFGFDRHNGEDVRLGTDKNIYAPVKMRVVQIGNHPTGAGIFVSGISLNAYDDWKSSGPTPYRVYFTFMHLEKPLCEVGDFLDIGDTIAIADNTGFSTGQHTHIFAARVMEENGAYKFVDESLKSADYSFDHTKYYVNEYAIDYKAKKLQAEAEEIKKLESIKYKEEIEQKKLGIIAQILELIRKILALK